MPDDFSAPATSLPPIQVQSKVKESERITRKMRIDLRLKGVRWSLLVPFDEQHAVAPASPTAVEEWITANGPADYALCANQGTLGVVESKQRTIGPGGVLTQAVRATAFRGELGPSED